MSQHKLFGFTHVDETADANYYIRFLDAATADPSFQAYKRHTATLLKAAPGLRLLDVGCGTGDDARMLAALVAPSGEVVGVDGSQIMIDEARRRGTGGLPVRFEVANAHKLPFADASFDGSRCDRTFMHLEDPLQALSEMVRVTKPGGRVVVYEVDFGAITIDVENKSLARKIIDCWCDSVRDGWRGRRVPAMFRDTGLHEVAVIPAVVTLNYEVGTPLIGKNTAERARSLGIITAAETQEWITTLDELRDAGRFFCTLTGFIVAGTK
jgi:ubiquinone/menaquinone biosynthesis C-methylase UbiE